MISVPFELESVEFEKLILLPEKSQNVCGLISHS